MTDLPHTDHPHHPPLFRFTFRARIVLLTTGLAANVLILAGVVDSVSGVIGFSASVVTYAIITLLFWRCPHCSKYPGNAVMPDYCEKCGGSIFGVDAHMRDRVPHGETNAVRLRYILAARGIYGLALLAYFVIFAQQQSTAPGLFWAGALFFVATGAWFEWRWWRCPHCGGYLKRSIWPGRTCRKCGRALRY